MKISVLTPSYNHDKYIARCVDSVLSQQGDFELEYVVIDGKSTDGTIEILNKYGSQFQWRSQQDRGQIDAINQGFSLLSGEVVGWLNSDDILLPGALQKVADAFAFNKDRVWLHGGCIIIDEADTEIRNWISKYKRFCSLRYSRRRLLSQNFISQMTVFWRRAVMRQIGVLDESYPLAFDYDYWLRMSAIGDPLYIDQPLAAFRWYPTSKSGANYTSQVKEEEIIASQYGISRIGGLKKRFKNRLRLGVYRGLDALQSVKRTEG